MGRENRKGGFGEVMANIHVQATVNSEEVHDARRSAFAKPWTDSESSWTELFGATLDLHASVDGPGGSVNVSAGWRVPLFMRRITLSLMRPTERIIRMMVRVNQ